MCPVHNIGRKPSPGALHMIVLEINAMVRSRARDFNVNNAELAPARLCAPALATRRIICHTLAQDYAPAPSYCNRWYARAIIFIDFGYLFSLLYFIDCRL